MKSGGLLGWQWLLKTHPPRWEGVRQPIVNIGEKSRQQDRPRPAGDGSEDEA